MLFALKLIFSATTVDTPAFFWLEFVGCIFSHLVLHLRAWIAHFLISLVFIRADLAGLNSRDEQTPFFNHEASIITELPRCVEAGFLSMGALEFGG